MIPVTESDVIPATLLDRTGTNSSPSTSGCQARKPTPYDIQHMEIQLSRFYYQRRGEQLEVYTLQYPF